jgi:predicted nuclease with RNAse H fold
VLTFEYRYVRVVDESAGAEAALRELNRLGSEGWEILPVLLPGGRSLAKRAIRCAEGMEAA